MEITIRDVYLLHIGYRVHIYCARHKRSVGGAMQVHAYVYVNTRRAKEEGPRDRAHRD